MTLQPASERLIVALDTTDPDMTAGSAKATAPQVCLLKLRLAFFLANGAAGYRAAQGLPIVLDDAALHSIRVPGRSAAQVIRSGQMAMASDMDGLVCSPLKEATLPQQLGPAAKPVVPGMRPAGADAGDQARIMSPAQAIAAGADWIVAGRPITTQADPGAAAAANVASL